MIFNLSFVVELQILFDTTNLGISTRFMIVLSYKIFFVSFNKLFVQMLNIDIVFGVQ